MISDHDRSGFFGASDTKMIMGNWATKSFMDWWLVKMGRKENPSFLTRQMAAGNAYEHKILDCVGATTTDRQIIFPELRLRVNLDGETEEKVIEVKTTGKKPSVSKAYWQQAQVEMYATNKPLEMVFYQLIDIEYENFFRGIDTSRLTTFKIDRDEKWLQTEYLPRLKYLAWCLDTHKTPTKEEFNEGTWNVPFEWSRWLCRYATYFRLKFRRICSKFIRRTSRLRPRYSDFKI